jgi:hypothetical protein
MFAPFVFKLSKCALQERLAEACEEQGLAMPKPSKRLKSAAKHHWSSHLLLWGTLSGTKFWLGWYLCSK